MRYAYIAQNPTQAARSPSRLSAKRLRQRRSGAKLEAIAGAERRSSEARKLRAEGRRIVLAVIGGLVVLLRRDVVMHFLMMGAVVL